jgi:hypothetical protein
MDTNRGFIIGMALFAALTATSTVAAAEASSSVEGTLYAAAPRVQHPALDPDTAKRQPRSPSNVVPVRDLRADRAVSGSEPDPETFDKVGLESWWSKHRKAAK